MHVRRAKVLEMRLAGHNYQDIADELNVSKRTVGSDLHAAVESIIPSESKQMLADLELGRLDELRVTLLEALEKGREEFLKSDIPAVQDHGLSIILSVTDRLMRLSGVRQKWVGDTQVTDPASASEEQTNRALLMMLTEHLSKSSRKTVEASLVGETPPGSLREGD